LVCVLLLRITAFSPEDRCRTSDGCRISGNPRSPRIRETPPEMPALANSARFLQRRPATRCNCDALHPGNYGTRFAVCGLMRRHHEATTTTIVSALAMVIPVAGGLWARVISLRKTAAPSEKPAEASDERKP
jgi:hypothetical protein